jgi:hypothetical protein
MKKRFTADIFARVLRRLEAGDSVPLAAEAEGVTPGQVNGRLRKLGMVGEKRPVPQPQSAAELDRLLYPNDPPLTRSILDYLEAFDSHLCDPESVVKFVRWRKSARALLGGKLDEPAMSQQVMKEIADASRRPSAADNL